MAVVFFMKQHHTLMSIIGALDQQLLWSSYDGEVAYSRSLVARRNARGLSQRRLAKAIGVSQTMIMSLEKTFKGGIENLEKVLHQLKLVPRLVKLDGASGVVDVNTKLPDEVADLLDGTGGNGVDDEDQSSSPAFIVDDATDVL